MNIFSSTSSLSCFDCYHCGKKRDKCDLNLHRVNFPLIGNGCQFFDYNKPSKSTKGESTDDRNKQ
jgi:hypothetical protein